SMSTYDGNKLEKCSQGAFKATKCSRWAELTDSLRFHATVAEKLGAPTEFRFLNGSYPIVVGIGDGGEAYGRLMAQLAVSPGGMTPLCGHIREIVHHIRTIAPSLQHHQQRAVVVIASDGEASDGDVAAELRHLVGLPVWVVIRLCTDDEKIVSYWNNIDQELELEMDVLDDFFGEAKEVSSVNSWVTYGEPLHKLREWGVHMKEMDFIDEQRLSPEMARSMCAAM
ncbi:unnamed protein product, partial [Symbiodinium microadriaticum]